MISKENLTNLEYQEHKEEKREAISYILKKNNISFTWKYHTLVVEMKDIPAATQLLKLKSIY